MCRTDKLVKRPFGNLDDAVIERRFKAGKRLFRNCVLNFVERIPQSDLAGHFCNRITGRFAGQRRRTADAGIDLNDTVFKAVRVQRKLHIAAAFHAELRDDIERGRAQHLCLFIGKRLAGCDNDGIARMHTNGIEIFHVADRNAVAVVVAHDFIFNLFPPGDRAFNQHLVHTAALQADFRNFFELVAVVRNPAAAAAQRVSGTHYNRIPDAVCYFEARFQVLGHFTVRAGLVNALHGLLEELPVLCHADGVGARADHLHIVFFQKAALFELYSEI